MSKKLWSFELYIEIAETSATRLPQTLVQPDFTEETIEDAEYLEILSLHKAIKQLKEKQRRRIFLHFFKGLNFTEIGALEKTSKMAISYSVNAALRNSKKILGKLNN